ncbi:MAG: ATP-binding protein [bacterium]
MSLVHKFKILFSKNYDDIAYSSKHLFNFKKLWIVIFLLSSFVAIVPLLFFAFIDYKVTQKALETEVVMKTSHLTSNTSRFVSFFLDERKLALDFILANNNYQELKEQNKLDLLLKNLKATYGGFTDLGVIDSSGIQINYSGPYNLAGKNYKEQLWFEKACEENKFITDVFLGYRNVPHLAIVIKHDLVNGGYFLLRATIEDRFINLLSQLEISEKGDAFIINDWGILQTPSKYFGKVFNRVSLDVPERSEETKIIKEYINEKDELIIGYIYLKDTPFILMIVKDSKGFSQPWKESSVNLIEYLIISIIVILLWIIGITTFFVRRLKATDSRRIKNMQMAEHGNKMASIGRLSANIAHEINNPLAIINEKAGLIQDRFIIQEIYKHDEKLLKAIDIILSSVERCGKITKRLLRFAKHKEVTISEIHMEEVVLDVLGFLDKEAEFRSIKVNFDINQYVPKIQSDRGKLQQILLNLINNAFAAMTENGILNISFEVLNEEEVQILIQDNGCGISRENLKKIFDPFFTTKHELGGSGLGLSITYTLLQELGGSISVESEVNKGTIFKVTLPVKFQNEHFGEQD